MATNSYHSTLIQISQGTELFWTGLSGPPPGPHPYRTTIHVISDPESGESPMDIIRSLVSSIQIPWHPTMSRVLVLMAREPPFRSRDLLDAAYHLYSKDPLFMAQVNDGAGHTTELWIDGVEDRLWALSLRGTRSASWSPHDIAHPSLPRRLGHAMWSVRGWDTLVFAPSLGWDGFLLLLAGLSTPGVVDAPVLVHFTEGEWLHVGRLAQKVGPAGLSLLALAGLACDTAPFMDHVSLEALWGTIRVRCHPASVRRGLFELTALSDADLADCMRRVVLSGYKPDWPLGPAAYAIQLKARHEWAIAMGKPSVGLRSSKGVGRHAPDFQDYERAVAHAANRLIPMFLVGPAS